MSKVWRIFEQEVRENFFLLIAHHNNNPFYLDLEINDSPPRYSHLVRVFFISPDYIVTNNEESKNSLPRYEDLFTDVIIQPQRKINFEKFITNELA